MKKLLILLLIAPSLTFAQSSNDVLSASCQPADFKIAVKAIQVSGESLIKAKYPNADTIRISVRFKRVKDTTTQAVQLTNVLPEGLLEFAEPAATSTPTATPTASVGAQARVAAADATPTAAPTAPADELRLVSGAVLPVPPDACSAAVDARIKLRYKLSGARVKKEWNGRVTFSGTIKFARGAK